jgi:endo-1,4-beta-xylanase
MTAAGGAAGMSTAGSAGNNSAGTGGAGPGGATGAGGASGGVGGSAGGSAGASGGAAGALGGSAGAGTGGVAPMDATCGDATDATGVAEKYAGCFPIGAAVDSGSYTSHSALLKAHFNSVTAENEMKFASLEPNEGSFTYSTADAIVNFATTNKMKIRGHTLVWHSQNPSWLFSGASKDTLLARMKKHISNVVGHFKGKVYAWDVVNEAIMEDGSYRDGNEADDKKSQWYSIMGESYIAEAFKAAHEADPDAKLFYNDFYDYIPAKQQGIYDMLKGLLDAGVPVHGVGMQCHLNIQPSTDASNQAFYQDVSHLEDAIKLYSSLGLDVQVTELDLSLYVPGITYTSDTYYTTATFTDELKAKQAARYKAFFELFRRYRNVITGVTFWGIADDNTWLSEFSSGRQDFPLLFDVNHNPKPAYDAVIDF